MDTTNRLSNAPDTPVQPQGEQAPQSDQIQRLSPTTPERRELFPDESSPIKSELTRQVSKERFGSSKSRTSLLSEQLAGVRITEAGPPRTPGDAKVYTATLRQGLDEGRAALRKYLSRRTVYSLMPESGKVVVLDEDLKIKNAFEALGEHGNTACTLSCV